MMMYEFGAVEFKANRYSYRDCPCCGNLIAYLNPDDVKRRYITIVCQWCDGEFKA